MGQSWMVASVTSCIFEPNGGEQTVEGDMTKDKHTLNNDCEQWDILGRVGRHSRDFLTSAVVIYDRLRVVSGAEELGPAHAPILNESWQMCQLLSSLQNICC